MPTDLILALVAALAFSATTVWQTVRAAGSDAPRVVVLGCGSSLSVLVTAGDARVLIAQGTRPADFGNAVRAALGAGGNRIDLMIVAATGKDLAVPIDLAHGDSVRKIVRLGSPHPSPETADLPLDLPQAPALARLTFGDGIAAIIETAEIPKDGGRSFELAWRATIREGDAVVTVLSDSAHARQFAPLTSTGVLIVTDGDDFGDVLPTRAGAVIFGADATSAEIRTGVPPLIDHDLPVLRVADGEALVLPVTPAGVEVPPNRAMTIRPAGAGTA